MLPNEHHSLQVYYTAGFVLHYVVPRLFAVKSVQQRKPRPGQVAQEALHSIGALPASRRGAATPLWASLCVARGHASLVLGCSLLT